MSKENFLAQYGDSDHITDTIDKKPHWRTVDTILKHNISVTPKHIDKLLDHKDMEVRSMAINHENASIENVGKPLKILTKQSGTKRHKTKMRVSTILPMP